MAITLSRKRLRDDSEEGDSANLSSTGKAEPADIEALFRKHFEAQFEPLPGVRSVPGVPKQDQETEDEESDFGSAWQGLSDEDDATVELQQHDASRIAMPEMTREEFKMFMTSKPPSSTKTPTTPKAQPNLTTTDTDETANLKKDLALHRLLKESHLLSPSSNPSSSSSTPLSLSHTGKTRHKAHDLRLQSLGAQTSIFHQDKMPLAYRRGMLLKSKNAEATRRSEALQNGIVLEKASAKKRSDGRRERERGRAIGAPAVGRFQGGTLKLSSKDVAEIQGPRKTVMGGKGAKKGGGGKRKRR